MKILTSLIDVVGHCGYERRLKFGDEEVVVHIGLIKILKETILTAKYFETHFIDLFIKI